MKRFRIVDEIWDLWWNRTFDPLPHNKDVAAGGGEPLNLREDFNDLFGMSQAGNLSPYPAPPMRRGRLIATSKFQNKVEGLLGNYSKLYVERSVGESGVSSIQKGVWHWR